MSALRSPPPAAPAPETQAEFRGIRRPLLGLSGTLLSAFGAIALVSVVLLASTALSEGEPPLCRKSAAMAVVPAGAGGASNASLEVLVWSGMGRHRCAGALCCCGAALAGCHRMRRVRC